MRALLLAILTIVPWLATAAATAADADCQAIEAEARKQGLVAIYQDFSPSGVAQIIDVFHEAYPQITVREVRLPRGNFYPRFATEYAAGRSEADMCSGDEA
jgi:ABC-type glycerol-3-phosphate transport system substrate-binding protein